jgi:hypothetical protein
MMKRELVRAIKYGKVGIKSDIRKIIKLARLIRKVMSDG